MTKLKVVQAPAEILNQIAKPVTFKEKDLGQLLLDMEETLLKHEEPPGVGLAGPQVGISLRIYLALLGTNKKGNKGEVRVFINPEILESKGESVKTKEGKKVAEGCLSLKNYYGYVNRAIEVKVKYKTIDLGQLKRELGIKSYELRKLIEERVEIFCDFEARIMLHEMDHLNGRLFTSRLLEQGGKLFELHEENGETVWEEVDMSFIPTQTLVS